LQVVDCLPSLKTTLSVLSDLSVVVCVSGVKVDVNKFSWVLGIEGKLDCWSNFSTMLSHLQASDVSVAAKTAVDKVKNAANMLHDVCECADDVCVDDSEDDGKFSRAVKFCMMQLRLSLMKQIRYSADFLRWAFQVFSLSPNAYSFLRDSCLALPHPSYLRTLSSCFSVDAGTESSEHVAYLAEKAKLLDEHERHVAK